MQVPVEALECLAALCLIGDNNRWRPDSFFLNFGAELHGVCPETDPHFSPGGHRWAESTGATTVSPTLFSPQLLTYPFDTDPRPDARGVPFGIRQGSTCNLKPSALFRMTWTDDVLQYTSWSGKVSRGVEVNFEWRVTPDFHPGDRSLCPTKHHQSFPKPKNMALDLKPNLSSRVY